MRVSFLFGRELVMCPQYRKCRRHDTVIMFKTHDVVWMVWVDAPPNFITSRNDIITARGRLVRYGTIITKISECVRPMAKQQLFFR